MASRRFDSGQFLCQAPWCDRKKDHDHHVIYEQHVKKAGGDVNDHRNALGICASIPRDGTSPCHGQQHNGQRRLPVTCLRDENIEFAFELLGLAASYYFNRYYTGTDERIETAVQALIDMEDDDAWT